MTKKEYFGKFFSNSGWGFLGWCIFNLIFFITYIIVGHLDDLFERPTGPELYECWIIYIAIYIVSLIPSFLMGFFWMKKTGNIISDFVSLLPIRFLTVVSSLWIAGYHYYYNFANFSVITLETMLDMAYEYRYFAYELYMYPDSSQFPPFDFDPIFVYITSIIPFVVTFIGFQIGKKRRKNQQEEIKE